jgi:hypothetical protein
MPTMPARSRLLLLIGIAVNLVVFSLNYTAGLIVNRGDYTPFAVVVPQVSAQVFDETQLYAPGPSRFFRTGEVQAELDVFELRHVPNSYPVLHSILLGLLAKAMGSLEWGWMVSHAIVPALIWAVLFWNACRFVHSGFLAMAIAWAVCFVSFGPRNFLLLGQDRFIQPLELGRMPQPALAFLFLILAIWLLSRALARPVPGRLLLAGVMAGSLFYLYYFYWIAFFAGAASLLIVAAIIKRWDYVRTVAAIILLGCLTGTPFFIWTLDAMHSGHQRDLMSRVGSFTRTPDLIGLILALVLIVALWLYCRRQILAQSDEQTLFGAVLLAVATGAAIGLNFQLLTGFNAQHGHFYNRALQPLLSYFFVLMLFRRVRKPVFAATAAAIGILIAVAAVRQIQAGRNTAPYHRKSNPDIDVLSWTRSHLPPDVVIGSNDGYLLMLIPAIAGTWTFVPLGDRSMASNAEILTRYLLLCRLEGKSWQETETELRSNLQPNVSSLSYILLMQRKIFPETIETARAIWRDIDLRDDFKNRRLDYLIIKRANSEQGVSTVSEPFDTLYQNSNWRVVRVLKH